MALCLACSNNDQSIEFDTVAELVSHTKGGHKSRPAAKLPAPRKPVTPSATEIAGTTKVKQDPQNMPEVSEAPPSPPPPPKPLSLHYKWLGVHAACGSEPRTILVPTEANSFVCVAFCVNCDKQLEDRLVPAIPNPKK